MVMSSLNLTTLSYRFKSDQVSDDYEIQGQVFAPRSSRSQPATLIYDGLEFIIKDDFEIIAEDLELESIQGKRDIYFTDGRMFTAFHDFPPGLPVRCAALQSQTLQGLRSLFRNRLFQLHLF